MVKIIFSKECLNYGQSGYPESPERVKKTYALLKTYSFDFVKPRLATEREILEIHPKSLLMQIKNENFFDFNSLVYKNLFYYTSLSVGAAIKAMELSLKNNFSFSLMRPPGHHASQKPEGFCYFNNIAIAVAKALKQVKKVAVLDIDAHHGNGTQDLFLGNKNVIYVSLHQKGIYPGSGLKSEKNCYNFPLDSGTNEREYLEVLKKAIQKIEKFSPDIIAVSAGFDTYKNDPLADINLEIETYEKISNEIIKLNKPVFSVLEGGYSSELPQCIYSYLRGFREV